ncbi:hypothetical protein CALCODRAFT_500829 [Calocera cornea HHB12733]|uniref:FAD-binding FR-type domain-containing protein n=1 Tax=Calocera cornea HHB12733 TaxID=1353952 RepID=A0A165DWG3_9BASI|nr:hypothetical protein CALCODRAFT_500829 [Calocera cornea HHB12733]
MHPTHPRYAPPHAVLPTPKSGRRLPLVLGATAVGLSLAAWYLVRPAPAQPLNPHSYTPALITTHTHPTPRTSLIRIRLTDPAPPPGPFYALWIKSPQVQIERPYTPLRGLEGPEGVEGGEGAEGREVELWVKHEDGGEVSRYLGGKRAGEGIEVRGWTPTLQWEDKAWDEVVMISGGTGIAPFYQLLHHLFLRSRSPSPSQPPPPSTRPRFTLLHGSLSPSELPPSEILGPLVELQRREPDRFRLRLFVDRLMDGAGAMGAGQEAEVEVAGQRLPLTVGRIRREDLVDAVRPSHSPPPPPSPSWRGLLSSFFPASSRAPPAQGEKGKGKKVLFLVCGPEPMVEAYAGPRARDLSEGEVGGVLGGMGYGRGEVRKL